MLSDFPFLKVKESQSLIFKSGFLYHVGLKKTRGELIQLGIDAALIERLSHYWIIVDVEQSIKAFILTSQFFKTLFKEEIGLILDFHNEECIYRNCSHLNKFIGKTPSFKNILKKYKEEAFSVNRKNIYLLNKDTYSLPLESIINIEKLFEFNYDLFKSYYESGYIEIREICEVAPRDRFMIAAQIKANLEEDKISKIQREENEVLGKLYKQWIKIY